MHSKVTARPLLVRPRGIFEKIADAIETLQYGFNGVLFSMEQDRDTAGYVVLFELVVDTFQMLSLVVPRKEAMHFGAISQGWDPLAQTFAYTQFDFILREWVGQTPTLIVCLVVVIIELAIILYFAHSWTRNEFKSLWTVRVLRSTTHLLVTVLYIPILSTFFADGLRCGSDNSACYILIPITMIVSILFVCFSLAVSLSLFDQNPKSTNRTAMPHARFVTIHVTVQTLWVISGSLIGSKNTITLADKLLWIALTVPPALSLAYVFTWYQPYYNQATSTLRAMGACTTAWAAICSALLILMHDADGNSLTTSTNDITLSLIGGAVLVLPLGGLLAFKRRVSIAEKDITRCSNSFDVELKARLHIQGIFKGPALALVPPDEMKVRIKKAKEWYAWALERFSQSPAICVFYAEVLIAFEPNSHAIHVRNVLSMAERRQPGVEFGFTISKAKRILEQDSMKNTDILSVISREKFQREADDCDKECSFALFDLWTELGKPTPNLDQLSGHAQRIAVSSVGAIHAYSKLIELSPNDTILLRRYGSFLVEIANDTQYGYSMIQKADHMEKLNNQNMATKVNLDDVASEKCGVIVVGTLEKERNQILSANATAARVLQTAQRNIVGQNFGEMVYPKDIDLVSFLEAEDGNGEPDSCPPINTVFTAFLKSHRGGCVQVEMKLRPFTANGSDCNIVVSFAPHISEQAFWLTTDIDKTPNEQVVLARSTRLDELVDPDLAMDKVATSQIMFDGFVNLNVLDPTTAPNVSKQEVDYRCFGRWVKQLIVVDEDDKQRQLENCSEGGVSGGSDACSDDDMFDTNSGVSETMYSPNNLESLSPSRRSSGRPSMTKGSGASSVGDRSSVSGAVSWDSLREITQNAGDKTHPVLSRTRRLYFSSMLFAMLLMLAELLVQNQVMDDFLTDLFLTTSATRLAGAAVQIAYSAHSIALLSQGVQLGETQQLNNSRESLSAAAQLLRDVQLEFYEQRASFSPELRKLYEEDQVFLKKVRNGQQLTLPSNLLENSLYISGIAELVANTPMEEIPMRMDRLWALIANNYGKGSFVEILITANTLHAHHAEEKVQRIIPLISATSMVILVVTVTLLACSINPLMRKNNKVDQSKNEVVDIFLNLPKSQIKEIANRYRDRLETEHDIAIEDALEDIALEESTTKKKKKMRFRKKVHPTGSSDGEVYEKEKSASVLENIRTTPRRAMSNACAKFLHFHYMIREQRGLLVRTYSVVLFCVLYFALNSVFGIETLSEIIRTASYDINDLGQIQAYSMQTVLVMRLTEAAADNFVPAIDTSESTSLSNLGLLEQSFASFSNGDPESTNGFFKKTAKSPEVETLFLRDGCVGHPNQTTCRTFLNGLLANGLHTTLLEIIESVYQLLPMLAAFPFQQGVEMYTIAETLIQAYLYPQLSMMMKFEYDYVTALVDSTKKLRIILLPAFFIACAGCYIFGLRPVLQTLDRTVRRMRRLLLLIPTDIVEENNIRAQVLNMSFIKPVLEGRKVKG